MTLFANEIVKRFGIMDEERALKSISNLKMSETARWMMVEIIEDFLFVAGHFRQDFFNDSISIFDARIAFEELANLEILNRFEDKDLHGSVETAYFINISKFYELERVVADTILLKEHKRRSREELKSIMKIVS